MIVLSRATGRTDKDVSAHGPHALDLHADYRSCADSVQIVVRPIIWALGESITFDDVSCVPLQDGLPGPFVARRGTGSV